LSNWQYLDFGGGFGFPYYDRRQSFEWQEFGDALTSAIKRTSREIDLVIEPGRSIIAGCAALLCTVVSSKWQGEKQIVGVDTTTANIAVLSVHGGTRQVRCYKDTGTEHQTDVCGNTTYSRDYLSRSNLLPEMSEGDLLAILDAGAYGYSMSSHFLHRPRLPEVLIENGSHRLIRKRETYDCLLANQVE
jgi:diaminopimelate decarboxylase